MKPALRNNLLLLAVLSLLVPPALSAPYSAEGASSTPPAAQPAKKSKPKHKHQKVDVSPMAQPDSMTVPIGPTPPAGTSPGGPGPLQ